MTVQRLGLTVALAVVLLLVVGPAPARAAEGMGGDGGSAGASAGGGTVTVGAGSTGSVPSAPSGTSGGTSDESCTYTAVDPAGSQLLGIGGPMPGQWMVGFCSGPSAINPLAPMWVTSGQTPQQAMPVVVARQALAKMSVPPPIIETSPASDHDQIVRVPTWLWIDSAVWTSRSVTASAGGVTATATAIPVDVVWDMGDGHQVVCANPGTPYNTAMPASAQSTDCSYTWTQSSAGQPNASFVVTATVQWRVTWTVVGAVGGGNLGVIDSPKSVTAMRVAEIQAINQQPN